MMCSLIIFSSQCCIVSKRELGIFYALLKMKKICISLSFFFFFLQLSEDTRERPGQLTHTDEKWQENEETLTGTEERESELEDNQENTNTEPTEYQPQ